MHSVSTLNLEECWITRIRGSARGISSSKESSRMKIQICVTHLHIRDSGEETRNHTFSCRPLVASQVDQNKNFISQLPVVDVIEKWNYKAEINQDTWGLLQESVSRQEAQGGNQASPSLPVKVPTGL